MNPWHHRYNRSPVIRQVVRRKLPPFELAARCLEGFFERTEDFLELLDVFPALLDSEYLLQTVVVAFASPKKRSNLCDRLWLYVVETLQDVAALHEVLRRWSRLHFGEVRTVEFGGLRFDNALRELAGPRVSERVARLAEFLKVDFAYEGPKPNTSVFEQLLGKLIADDDVYTSLFLHVLTRYRAPTRDLHALMTDPHSWKSLSQFPGYKYHESLPHPDHVLRSKPGTTYLERASLPVSFCGEEEILVLVGEARGDPPPGSRADTVVVVEDRAARTGGNGECVASFQYRSERTREKKPWKKVRQTLERRRSRKQKELGRSRCRWIRAGSDPRTEQERAEDEEATFWEDREKEDEQEERRFRRRSRRHRWSWWDDI